MLSDTILVCSSNLNSCLILSGGALVKSYYREKLLLRSFVRRFRVYKTQLLLSLGTKSKKYNVANKCCPSRQWKILKRQSNQVSCGKNVYDPRHLEAIKIGSWTNYRHWTQRDKGKTRVYSTLNLNRNEEDSHVAWSDQFRWEIELSLFDCLSMNQSFLAWSSPPQLWSKKSKLLASICQASLLSNLTFCQKWWRMENTLFCPECTVAVFHQSGPSVLFVTNLATYVSIRGKWLSEWEVKGEYCMDNNVSFTV